MRLPFDGTYKVTTPFGVYDPVYANYPGSRHPGTDYALPMRTRVLAAMDGNVTTYDRNPDITTGRGKEVVITNGAYEKKECHLAQIVVPNGTWVREGALIAYSGSTGYSSGPHLHSELKINGQYVDQEKYLNEGSFMDFNSGDARNLLFRMYGVEPTKAEIDAVLDWVKKGDKKQLFYETIFKRFDALNGKVKELSANQAVNKDTVVDYVNKNLR